LFGEFEVKTKQKSIRGNCYHLSW